MTALGSHHPELFFALMETKIKIAISSCLLGNNVRYDGGNKIAQHVLDAFRGVVEFVPFCPECEAGLGVPREPMRLIKAADGHRLVTIATNIDCTDAVFAWSEQKVFELQRQNLCGFIFKARSPSCAIRDAEISLEGIGRIVTGSGLFAAAVVRAFPTLPVADEELLQDVDARERFLRMLRENASS